MAVKRSVSRLRQRKSANAFNSARRKISDACESDPATQLGLAIGCVLTAGTGYACVKFSCPEYTIGSDVESIVAKNGDDLSWWVREI